MGGGGLLGCDPGLERMEAERERKPRGCGGGDSSPGDGVLGKISVHLVGGLFSILQARAIRSQLSQPSSAQPSPAQLRQPARSSGRNSVPLGEVFSLEIPRHQIRRAPSLMSRLPCPPPPPRPPPRPPRDPPTASPPAHQTA